MEVCKNCEGINIVYIGNEQGKYQCKDCGFVSEECSKRAKRKQYEDSIRMITRKGTKRDLTDDELDRIFEVIVGYK